MIMLLGKYLEMKLFLEYYNASVLSDIPSKELGMFNRMVYLPDTKPYGFWMDRHGNYLPVKGGIGSHEKAAIKVLNSANDNLPPHDRFDFDQIPSFYDLLLNAGWLRILTTSNVYWEGKPGAFPNNIQKRNLEFIKDFYGLKNVLEG